MSREIFRKHALNRMSSPEQLDQMLQVTSPRSWIALMGVGVVLVSALIWSIWGRIATKDPGRGVVIRAGNLVTVGSLGTGRVQWLGVHPGDVVHKGQQIASVSQPLLQDKVDAARLDLQKLQGRRSPEANMGQTGLGLAVTALNGQKSTIDQQILAIEEQRKELKDQIASTQEVYEKGLVTRQQVTTLKQHDADLANQISSLRVQQTQLNGSEFKERMGLRERVQDLDTRIRDAESTLKLMEEDYNTASKVISPYDGEVVSIGSQPGTMVQAGSTIISMQPLSQQMEVVAYVPASRSKEIKPGMDAEIVPGTVRPEEFGFIRGSVASVQDYPATDVDLMTTFQNNALAKIMLENGSVTEIRIRIHRDTSTPSGFEWSSKKGAPIQLTPGTICMVHVISKEERPIRMVFPFLKAKIGLY